MLFLLYDLVLLRAFLCYFLILTTMHLTSFISHNFTFAYSKSHDTDCVIYSKSILLKTHLDLLQSCCALFWVFYVIAFQRYRISASALQNWLGFCFVYFLNFFGITWSHPFFPYFIYCSKSCMRKRCNYVYVCPTKDTHTLPFCLRPVPCKGLF